MGIPLKLPIIECGETSLEEIIIILSHCNFHVQCLAFSQKSPGIPKEKNRIMKTENKNKSTHDPVTETIQKQIFK